MPLTAGTRLGPYEIVAPLGAGAMGEVYRATDTRLDRAVAIKVLPESFADDADRVARFTREARTLAALNHPNIAAIYGVEESGSIRALVMELVEGEDLSTLIGIGPSAAASGGSRPSDTNARRLRIDDAVSIARQMAEALEAAHEQGIIHRDLKPANIKVRRDGTVKVLDFGLAKALDPTGAASGDPMNSPTMTTRGTQVGMILGTAAYMAPEQATGKPLDRRADIWAFGCVLYEMLTGTRAFKGTDVTDTITAVLRDEPDWTALPADTPASVRHLLHVALEKDPRRRLRDAGDIPILLAGPAALASPVAARATRPASWMLLASAGLAALAFGVGAVVVPRWAPEPAQTPVHVGLALPPDGNVSQMAVTPDGTRIVYVGGGGSRLLVRALDSFVPVEIATGSLLSQPFISPSGVWVGYVDEATRVLKVPIGGGSPTALGMLDGRVEGATWLTDDTIVVATAAATGLLRLPAAGGPATPMTTPAAGMNHVLPQRLPDGRAVLFTITTHVNAQGPRQLAVADASTGSVTTLLQGGGPARLVPGGSLAYLSQGSLFVVPFDAAARTIPAGATPTNTRVRAQAFDVTSDGTLVFAATDPASNEDRGTLTWVDRSGRETAVPGEPRRYQYPAVSPDGKRVAVAALGDGEDIWLLDVATSAISRLTFDPATDSAPVWTADGRDVVFSSNRADGVFNLWRQRADGTGEAERLTVSAVPQFSTSVTPDGGHAVYWQAASNQSVRDVYMVALDGSRRVTPLVQTPVDDHFAAVSPDGRWLAYESNATGRRNVVVRPFPRTSGGQWQITTEGGRQPSWSRDGKELFFLGGNGGLHRMRVLDASGAFRVGPAEMLLPPRYYGALSAAGVARTYDVTTDGQRFVMIKPVEDGRSGQTPDLYLVQHWATSLGRPGSAR
jgi:eukaryotic-like serine/threonine-protein kinase